jgi:hypothetical protein
MVSPSAISAFDLPRARCSSDSYFVLENGVLNKRVFERRARVAKR